MLGAMRWGNLEEFTQNGGGILAIVTFCNASSELVISLKTLKKVKIGRSVGQKQSKLNPEMLC